MGSQDERLVYEPLLGNEVFLQDLQGFFGVPPELLQAIGARTSVQPYKLLSQTELNDLSSYGRQPDELQRIAATLLFLRQRLIETALSPTEVITESRDILSNEDLAKGHEDEISAALSYSPEEREEYLAVQAFSGGPAFLNTRLLPSLLPVSPGDDLVSGYLWTISYLNAEAEQRSITVGLTPGELEYLETAISRAKEQLKAMRGSVDSSRVEEG